MPEKHAFDHYFRAASIAADGISDEDKTIQVAFSSETPVLRVAREGDEKLGIAPKGTKYWEVLSHDRKHADLSQLDNGNGAVLLEHKDELEIGTVSRAKISRDKIGRAVLKFDGLTELSNATFERAKGDKPPGVSVGYWHTGLVKDDGEKDGYPVKVVSWGGDEVTITRKPADDNVGIGRSKMFRSAEGKWACLTCGELFNRSELDEDYECGCQSKRSQQQEKLSRAKSEDGEKVISHSEVRDKVNAALYQDSRFKSKSSNGDTRADFNLHDVHQIVDEDGEHDWEAIVSSPAWSGKYHCVEFDCDDDSGEVELGDSYEVEPKTTFEAIERGLTPDGRLIRSADKPYGNVAYADSGLQKDGKKRYPIDTKAHVKAAWSYIHQKADAAKYSAEDLAKVKGKIKSAANKFGIEISEERSAEVDSQNLTRTEKSGQTTPKTFMELTAEQKLEAEKMAKAALEPQLRTSIENEYRTRTAEAVKSRTKLNAEITKRADAFIKDHGMKKRGAAAEELRKIANEFITSEGEKPEAEVLAEYGQRSLTFIASIQPEPYLLRARGTDKEWKSYSMMRAIQSIIAKTEKDGATHLPDKSFELDVHQDMLRSAKENGGILGSANDAGGLWVPSDAPTPAYHARMTRDGRIQRSRMVGERFTRDLFTGDFGSGGALVPTELMTPIIEPLRNWTALDKVNVRFLGGLSGNIVIPRQTGVTAPQAVSEIGALVASQPDFDQIAAKPRRIGNQTKYSKQLLFQSSPDAESIVRDDNFKQIALLIDEFGINGSGAGSQPLGVMNQPGVFAKVFGGTPSIALIESFATAIRAANIREPVAFLTTSNVRGRWRAIAAGLANSTTVISGQQNAIWTGSDDEGMVTGRPAYDSQQIPNDQVILGAWDNLIWFQWAGIEVVVDPYTAAGTGEWVITMNTYNDFAVRHPQAFCISADSGNQ